MFGYVNKYRAVIAVIAVFKLSSPNQLFAQSEDTMQVNVAPIIVTAKRIPTTTLNVTQNVEVIDQVAFDAIKPLSVEDMLRSFSTIELRSRGPVGVQTDIGIRGSLFSQNLILIDGIRVNDPQTAHHNFNLPLSVTNIKQIEIMKGSGSALYGSDAYGGVINFVTKEPQSNSAQLRLSGGQNGFLGALGSLNTVQGNFSSTLSLDFKKSDGYRFDTEFENWNGNLKTNYTFDGGKIFLLTGYLKKNFGAFDFYSPGKNIPSKEWIKTGFLHLGSEMQIGSIFISPKIYYRRHDDKFMYDLRTPLLYVNTHQTHLYGAQILASHRYSENILVVGGVDYDRDDITSSRLGNHSRASLGVYGSMDISITPDVLLNAGARYDNHSAYGAIVNPNLGLNFSVENGFKLFFNSGRSFRAPSYTDLYYGDPSSIGNPNLKPETGWSHEAGVQYFNSDRSVEMTGSIFYRNQTNLIDYVQLTSGDLFRAQNFTRAQTDGFDYSGTFHFPDLFSDQTELGKSSTLRFAYTFMESTIDRLNAVNTRYSFTHPKHLAVATAIIGLPNDIDLTITHTYRYHNEKRVYGITDIRIGTELYSIKIFLSGTNIFNKFYEEIPGINLPGRWIIGGIETTIF